MSYAIKAILYILAVLIALAAIITAALYDWGNKGPGEAGSTTAAAEPSDEGSIS
jgi:hypothetical protein